MNKSFMYNFNFKYNFNSKNSIREFCSCKVYRTSFH